MKFLQVVLATSYVAVLLTAGTVDALVRSPSLEEQLLRQQLQEAREQIATLNGVLSKALEDCGNYTTSGWIYLPATGKYYSAVYEFSDWDQAGSICKHYSNNSHLVVIESETENEAIKEFLVTANVRVWRACGYDPGYPTGYWTSGQRVVSGDCGTEFVWKPYPGMNQPLTYTGWNDTQPDCHDGNEGCLHIGNGADWLNLNWNDLPCSTPQWILCELDL